MLNSVLANLNCSTMRPLLNFAFLLVLVSCQAPLSQDKPTEGSWHIAISPGKLSAALSPESPLLPLISAHRGGRFLEGLPENSIAAFEYTLSVCPAILEMDISMTKDSVLVLLHDASLDRTTNGTGKIEDKTWEAIRNLRLKDDFGGLTEHAIPTLEEALRWGKGKAILSLDVKRGVPFKKVVEWIHATDTRDCVFIITYNPADAKKVYQLDPNLMISASLRNTEEIRRMDKTGIPYSNLLAFTGTILSEKNHYQTLRSKGTTSIQGTMGNLDKMAETRGSEIYKNILGLGAAILATDRPEEAWEAIQPEQIEKANDNFFIRFVTK